jgi:hypothetical protein
VEFGDRNPCVDWPSSECKSRVGLDIYCLYSKRILINLNLISMRNFSRNRCRKRPVNPSETTVPHFNFNRIPFINTKSSSY